MVAKEKMLNQRERLIFGNPIKMRDGGKAIEGIKHANWTLLDDRGIIKEESYIPRGQDAAVIGMLHVQTHVREKRVGVFTQHVIEETYQDASMVTDVHHYGKIDKVFVAQQTPGNPSRIAKVRFRKIRKPELGDKHCLTPDHEVLTSKGWKFIDKVSKSDEVYVLKEDGSFGYEKPYGLYHKDCDNEMLYDLQSQQVDLRVTQDHNMWVKKRNSKAFEIVKAKDVMGTRVSYATSATNSNTGGYVATFDINDSIPEWVWGLSTENVRTLCNKIFDADTGVYVTTSATLADSLQRLALHAEWSARIKIDNTDANPLYFVCLNRDMNTPSVFESDREMLLPYTGKVYCIEVPSHVFYVRRNGKPVWTGNCSRHGQKGVVGMIIPQEDMPFSKDGIVPDIIINPHAFPSRMTIGHLVETVMSKMCCLEGNYGDGTVFLPFDHEELYNNLEKNGFDRHGNEILYNGRTGQQISTEIFFGPIFYYRLKHMVTDKIHARGGGPNEPRVFLTRQPTSGRSKKGGLRIGEMERDVLLAHGLSQFIKENMMEKSDRYTWAACKHCGIIAKYTPKKGIYECLGCANTELSLITTPYAFKLLVQELEAMGIQLRISTEEYTEELIPFHDDLLETIEEEVEETVKRMFDVATLPTPTTLVMPPVELKGGDILDLQEAEDDVESFTSEGGDLGLNDNDASFVNETVHDVDDDVSYNDDEDEDEDRADEDHMEDEDVAIKGVGTHEIVQQAQAPPTEPAPVKIIDLGMKGGGDPSGISNIAITDNNGNYKVSPIAGKVEPRTKYEQDIVTNPASQFSSDHAMLEFFGEKM